MELEFSLGPHQYRVVRTLNSAELYQDGDPAPIANSIGAVTERVTRLLGMTRDEFFNTYFTGQKELAVMADDRSRAGPVSVARARVRADPRGPGPTQGARSALRARLEALRAGLGDLAELEAAEARARARLAAAGTPKPTPLTFVAAD